MKRTDGSCEATWYEICVDGHLGTSGAAWFDGMAISTTGQCGPPQTLIRGHVRDQAALYGLIARARDLGLTLVSVRRLESREEIGYEKRD